MMYSDSQLKEADDFINKLRIENGGITPEDVEFLTRERPQVLESINALRLQLGASTKIVAEQLYHKKTRFVYELIQNAEDNQYSNTAQPRLCFTLQHDRIIVDSNEDGFTERNIAAICSVGQSTKTCIEGYIGEKGIGFKSVFTVARKVHVQSGPYSFAFEYQREGSRDNGLGMVTPLNEQRLQVPAEFITRIILYLRKDCDPMQLWEDFEDLPDTLLLFLKKLQYLSINIELPGSTHYHTTYAKKSASQASSRVTIEKKIDDSISTRDFWIKRRQVNDMPYNSAREDIHKAEVVLAFPIDSNDVPLLEDEVQQDVFAYLPLQTVGLKFLVQSDFITQANREDVSDCTWNQRLLQEVTKTFLHAIEDSNGFLQHDSMKYSWVRYVPTENIIHDLWRRFQAELLRELHTRKVFLSLDGQSRLLTAGKLRIVTDKFKDEDLEPLLPDLDSGHTAYISDEYEVGLDIPVMRKLGVGYLSIPDFLDRLKQNLSKDKEEIELWTRSVDDDWHTRVSNLLIEAIAVPNQKEIVQRMRIIPLSNGNWAYSFNVSIFFPTSGGVDIPDDLPLSLVDGNALFNERRKTLFSSLGVTECAPTRIFPLIEQRYKRRGSGSVLACCQDIKFMFWHNEKLPPKYAIYLDTTSLPSKKYTISKATEGAWIYCPLSSDLYSMFNLLGGKIPDELSGQVRFPRIEYYDTLKKCDSRNKMTGLEWFQKCLDIKVAPQLPNRVPFFDTLHKMSAELAYVAENIPHRLLGVLKRDWIHYFRSDEWDTRIRTAEVPILNCLEHMTLQETYLPLPKLKSKVKELDLEDSFGFLEELDPMTDVEVVKWNFLEHFGVGVEEGVSFWLALLYRAQNKEHVEKHHVFKIYMRLQTYDGDDDVEKLQKSFEEDDLVYVPSDASGTSWIWVNSYQCVWSGPNWLSYSYVYCLQAIDEYKPFFGLVVNALGLDDATLTDFLDYLKVIKTSEEYITDEEEREKIPLIYAKLNELAHDGEKKEVKDEIRTRISEDELVYYPKNMTWLAPSSCIWAEENIQLPGTHSIAASYKEQASFFRKVLGITKPSLIMHINALVQKASESPDKTSILQEIRNICALSPTPKDLLGPLSACACFPVRDPSGEIEWMTYKDTFAIIDRREYGDIFQDEIFTLDFSLEEVHSLEKFLFSLELETRLLSDAVTEDTEVEEGMLDQDLTDDIRRKAYAISRYAAHLGAPDALATYSLLQKAEVHTSEGISKTVSVVQDGETITIPGEMAYFHLDGEGDQLKLYVPRNKKHRQVCLARQLPISLLKHLGVQRPQKGTGLGSIVTAPYLFVVDEILQQDGIIEVAGITRPEDDDDDDTAISSESSQFVEDLSRLREADSSDDRYLIPATSVSLGSSSTYRQQREQPELYLQLLDAVIRQAENMEGLPRIGTSEEASVASSRTLDPISSSAFGEGWQRKIGAAGELFVYEVLSRLELPTFDMDCWQSTIRDQVAVHRRYDDITSWEGSYETADIVYRDSSGTLTRMLIQKGYLQHSWSGRTPTYYIEVKTTMGAVKNAFYCSQNQFDMMEEMKLPKTVRFDKVYMIVRVFGLGASRMGLRLYVDPATLRMKKELKFAAEQYTITVN